MTRDDIIRMAREAGCEVYEGIDIAPALVRFAELVAAAEREACAEAGAIFGELVAHVIRARRNDEPR